MKLTFIPARGWQQGKPAGTRAQGCVNLLIGHVPPGRQVNLSLPQVHPGNGACFRLPRLNVYALTYTLTNSMMPVARMTKFCTFFEVA
jgi:hypothetical protein